VRTVVVILILLLLTACGAVRAVHETERVLDEYNCIIRDLNKELRAIRGSQTTPPAAADLDDRQVCRDQ
jgi:uncharacterized protein YcfL